MKSPWTASSSAAETFLVARTACGSFSVLPKCQGLWKLERVPAIYLAVNVTFQIVKPPILCLSSSHLSLFLFPFLPPSIPPSFPSFLLEIELKTLTMLDKYSLHHSITEIYP